LVKLTLVSNRHVLWQWRVYLHGQGDGGPRDRLRRRGKKGLWDKRKALLNFCGPCDNIIILCSTCYCNFTKRYLTLPCLTKLTSLSLTLPGALLPQPLIQIPFKIGYQMFFKNFLKFGKKQIWVRLSLIVPKKEVGNSAIIFLNFAFQKW